MYELKINPDGSILTVYSDGAFDLYRAMGEPVISRASYVEPDRAGDWFADLSPVGGPKLGPFCLRGDALQAEMDWLSHYLIGGE